MESGRGRVLGIDYGSKRVGLALSDPLRILAGGGGTFQNDQVLLSNIVRLIEEQEVVLIVVGMPYAPDGGAGAKAREVEQFMQNLRVLIHVPITTWDESYSTREAAGMLRTAGMKRKQRQSRVHLDEMAARVMLQEFLDHSPSASRQ